MEPYQKTENNTCRIELMGDQGTAYNNPPSELIPYSIFNERLISVHPNQNHLYGSESKFFPNPLRARKVCVENLEGPAYHTDANKSINVLDLYAKHGNEILKIKRNILGHLKPLPNVEVIKLKSQIDSKFKLVFLEKSLRLSDQAESQAKTDAFVNSSELRAFVGSIISSMVKPESVLYVREEWDLISKSCGVCEIYAICQYILSDILRPIEK